MAANGNNQVAVISARNLYVINALTLTSQHITTADFLGGAYCTFQDGYLIVITPNSNQFQISGDNAVPVGDMTRWSAANISIQAGQQDLLVACISSREYLRLFGQRRSQVDTNVGSTGIGQFPFQSYNETFIETGLAATFSLQDIGDALIWIGQDQRGMRACWEDRAFSPNRISTFAVELAWQNYETVTDAIALTMIWNGHLWYQVTFPTANKTWVYDVTMSRLLGKNIWFERNFMTARGDLIARPERFYAYAFGKHLVGSSGTDGNAGAVYQVSGTQYGDCGKDLAGNQQVGPIIRDRICPHLWSQNKRVIYDRIEFELARGIGLDGSPPVGADPQLLLRWSNDAGNTWQPEINLPVGKLGDYTRRCYWTRNGYARDRVYWLRCTDPVGWGLIDAMLDLRVLAS
jgi:hypothetical protein